MTQLVAWKWNRKINAKKLYHVYLVLGKKKKFKIRKKQTNIKQAIILNDLHFLNIWKNYYIAKIII